MVKVGSQLFTAVGPSGVQELAALGFGIFLDLKFHDIPNTVAGAVASAAQFPAIRLLTIHTLGGLEMMRAARKAAGESKDRPKVLGVTILTSMDDASLDQVGIRGPSGTLVTELARLAQEAGLDGVVASAHEASSIRRACGPGFLIVVPGIRPASTQANDQSRIATPSAAIRAGADYLVVGRPITGAADPVSAAKSIAAEIEGAEVSVA